MTRTELGRIGEKAAALWLEERGYAVTGRNVRFGRYEIDLIAEDADHVCFVEVKTRRQFPDLRTPEGTPAEAVDRRKRAAMVCAADAWLRENLSEKSPRIDVMEIYADPESEVFRILKIRHLPDAVRKRGKFSRR